MFWIILAVLVFMGGIVWALVEKESLNGFVGVCMALIALGVGAIVYWGVGYCVSADEVYDTAETNICALTDNTGTFFVGRYHSDSSIFYSYLRETDNGGKVVGKIDAKDAILYDDEKEQPYIVEFKKHNSNPFVRFFFCTDRTKYEIHIPPESIRYDYGVDLK